MGPVRSAWLCSALLLLAAVAPEPGGACSCAPAHPQQLLCDAALAIRAKISSEKVVPASDDPLDSHKMIRYEIKQIKHYTKEKGKYVIYMQFNIHPPNVVIDLVILLTLRSHPRIKTVPLAFVTLSYIIRAAKKINTFYELDPIFQQMFEKVALGKILDMANQLALMTEHKNKVMSLEIHSITVMFKGFEKLKDVQYVYTPFDSSLCGVKLEANNKKQYLLTGKIRQNQRTYKTRSNCLDWLCKNITTCYMVPCSITAPNECLWTDWLMERRLYGHQAKHYACIKRSDGTCSWYRGGPPPEKEFIDISEP
ncbi:hypothetical protein Q9233_004266 [Columba guinea]|nr:hypothetical protein Q9233_004266 [Columba guinea]